MISEISVAVHGGMGIGRLAEIIHPYPTTAEAIRQCGEACKRQWLIPTAMANFHKLMALRR